VNGRSIGQITLAIVACGAVLSWAALWREYPGTVVDQCVGHNGPGISHCGYLAPLNERIIRISVAVSAVCALAMFSAWRLPRAKVVLSAAACTVSAWIALGSLFLAIYDAFGEVRLPSLAGLLLAGMPTATLGAVVAWAFLRWWPNKSLERTREG
jgi:hypothetical protein